MGKSPSDGRSDDGADRLTRERIFEVLSDGRRRAAIACLEEASTPVTLADLAARIVEREPSEAADRRLVQRSLYHGHVPKLDEADVVDHDPERNTVQPGAAFERVAAVRAALSEAAGGE